MDSSIFGWFGKFQAIFRFFTQAKNGVKEFFGLKWLSIAFLLGIIKTLWTLATSGEMWGAAGWLYTRLMLIVTEKAPEQWIVLHTVWNADGSFLRYMFTTIDATFWINCFIGIIVPLRCAAILFALVMRIAKMIMSAIQTLA